jgi:hypothetical protein
MFESNNIGLLLPPNKQTMLSMNTSGNQVINGPPLNANGLSRNIQELLHNKDDESMYSADASNCDPNVETEEQIPQNHFMVP